MNLVLGVLESGYSKSGSHVQLLDKMFDIRTWIHPVCADLHKHSIPHAFKISKGECGSAQLQYKIWSTDNEWLPDNHSIKLLKSKPTGTPGLVIPSSTKMNYEKLLDDIPKLLTSSAVRVVSEQQKRWWDEFLDERLPDLLSEQDPAEWPLPTILEKKLRTGIGENVDQPPQVSEELLLLHQRALHVDATTEVYTGSRRATGGTDAGCSQNENRPIYEVGQFVAATSDHWKEIPLIGEIKTIEDDSLTVHWWHGSWTTKWKPLSRRSRRCTEPWLETLPVQNILLTGFDFTRNKHLKLSVKEKLKQLYKV
ncbi:uncharacterized protein [Ptychodera flava]